MSSDDEEDLHLKEQRARRKRLGYRYTRKGRSQRYTPLFPLHKRVAFVYQAGPFGSIRRTPRRLRLDTACLFTQSKLQHQIVYDEERNVISSTPLTRMETVPPQVVNTFCNMAARQRALERLDRGWRQIHHALQPCSVCDMLSISVDESGEIKSSGRSNWALRYHIFPCQPCICVHELKWTRCHMSCYYLHCLNESRHHSVSECITRSQRIGPLPPGIIDCLIRYTSFHRT